jgi:DNA-binding beta-propeller fold protein YncE
LQPSSITFDPLGRYAYVANYGSSTVSQYTITNGLLTPNSPTTVAAGASPNSVTVDPSGAYAYAANISDNSISQYTITNGVLSPNYPATVAGEGGTGSIFVSAGTAAVQAVPQYAYVANFGNSVASNISQYTIGTNGDLAPNTTAPTVGVGVNPISITVDPSGQYAYVANFGDSTVSQYTIGTNGAFTLNSQPIVPTGLKPYSVTVDPSGKYAYVANFGDGLSASNIFLFTIGTGGALMPMTPLSVPAGIGPVSVTVDPSGKYAYVVNHNTALAIGTISQYTIGTTGMLKAMAPATVTTGINPTSITVDPSGRYAYVANFHDTTVSQYTIGPTGALSPIATAPTVTVGSISPLSVAVDPSGKFAYLASMSNILQFSIGTNGALSPIGTPVAGGWSVTVDPSGKFAYGAGNCTVSVNAGTVSQYVIGSNGLLTPNAVAATYPAGVGPCSVITTGTWQ